MRSRIDPRAPLVAGRIVSLAVLTMVLSGWTTCNAMFFFNGCQSSAPQLVSFSPRTISSETASTVLTLSGANFTSQSQIMWNGNALPTAFINAGTLQTTITQQTFATFGGTAGTTVQISVTTLASSGMSGCPSGGSSATFVVDIN